MARPNPSAPAARMAAVRNKGLRVSFVPPSSRRLGRAGSGSAASVLFLILQHGEGKKRKQDEQFPTQKTVTDQASLDGKTQMMHA